MNTKGKLCSYITTFVVSGLFSMNTFAMQVIESTHTGPVILFDEQAVPVSRFNEMSTRQTSSSVSVNGTNALKVDTETTLKLTTKLESLGEIKISVLQKMNKMKTDWESGSNRALVQQQMGAWLSEMNSTEWLLAQLRHELKESPESLSKLDDPLTRLSINEMIVNTQMLGFVKMFNMCDKMDTSKDKRVSINCLKDGKQVFNVSFKLDTTSARQFDDVLLQGVSFKEVMLNQVKSVLLEKDTRVKLDKHNTAIKRLISELQQIHAE